MKTFDDFRNNADERHAIAVDHYNSAKTPEMKKYWEGRLEEAWQLICYMDRFHE